VNNARRPVQNAEQCYWKSNDKLRSVKSGLEDCTKLVYWWKYRQQTGDILHDHARKLDTYYPELELGNES